MPSIQEEVFRIKYEALGHQEIDRLQKEIDDTEKHISRMGQAVKNGSLGMDAYSATVKKTAKELASLKNDLAGYQKAAAAATATTKAAGDAVEQTAAAARSSAGGFANAGNAVFQLTNLMEDAQFGARGLQNNVGQLIATMGGFSPLAMAAAGAGTILVGVFRDTIDSALEASGILDENLAKGLDKAKEKTDALAEAQKSLLATLPNVTAGIKDQVAAVGELAKKIEGTTASKLIEDAIIQESGYRAGDMQKANEDIKRLEKQRADALTAYRANPTDMAYGLYDDADRALTRARAVPAGIVADQQQFARKQWAMQVAQAGSSDAAALQQVARLRRLSDRTGNEDLANLAVAIEQMTTTFKETQAKADEDAAAYARRTQEFNAGLPPPEEGGMMAGVVDEIRRRQQRAADAADRAGAEAAEPVLRGAGDSVEAALMGGASPEQAAADLMQQLRALGYTIEEAFSAAARVTEEVNARTRANIRAEAIRNAMRWNSQQPWFNNRPNGF